MFKAHRLSFHSTLGSRVMKKREGVKPSCGWQGSCRSRRSDRCLDSGTILDLRTTSLQNGESVPRRAHI